MCNKNTISFDDIIMKINGLMRIELIVGIRSRYNIMSSAVIEYCYTNYTVYYIY